MSTTSEESDLSHATQQATSDLTPPIVSVHQTLSAEDKMIFYAVLRDIANELRRINREQRKHQAESNHLH